MTETNIFRIFKEKEDTLFNDKYGGVQMTAKEINEVWLRPTMQLNPDPESKEMKEIETFLERYIKV